MAVHWVDGVDGSDSNGGTSYADAKQTIPAGATLLNNDNDPAPQLNVVNSTSYTMSATSPAVDFDGTGSQDFLIQGVDAAGDPAFVTVIPPATGACYFMSSRTCNSTTVQYFDVNFHASRASSTTQTFWGHTESTHEALNIQYCRFRGTTDGTLPAGDRKIFQAATLDNNNLKTVRYCLIEDMFSYNALSGSTTVQFSFNNNVVIIDVAERMADGLFSGPSFVNSGHIYSVFKNTIYLKHLYNGSLPDLFQTTGTSGDIGQVDVYDNVVFLDPDNDGGTATLTGAVFHNTSGTQTPSSGTRGYNVFYSGVDLTDANIADWVDGTTFAPTSAKGYTTDSVATEQAPGALFKDVNDTYEWTPTGSALSFTLSKDLRLVAEETSGSGGGIPGALPLAVVNPSVTATTADALYVSEADVVNVLITYTEDSSTGSTGSTLTMTIPDEFDYIQDLASSGTYDSTSKVWTLGTLAGGATATLTLRLKVNTFVATDYDLTVTATITSHGSGLDLGVDVSDDVAFVGFAGAGGADSPETPGSPSRVPLLDVMPTTEPRFFLDVNQKIQTKRNRAREIYTRYDEESVQFSEFRSGVLVLATNTSSTYNMGGLERANYFMYEADNAVQLSINGGTFMPAAKQTAIAQGAITSLKFKNLSTSDDAEVYILVVD